jgi:outer membrane protein assembly factor BamB
MDNKKDELNEALGAFISRRKMNQMMGFGAAGAAFLPSLLKGVHAQPPKLRASPLSDFTLGPPIWNYTLPDSLVFAADPVFYNGTIIICTQNTNGTGSIYSLDTQTRVERWAHRLDFPTSFFIQPIITNGVIYVGNAPSPADDLITYAINADDGSIIWKRNYSIIAPPTSANGNLIFPTRDGYLYAINAQNPDQVVWKKFYLSTTAVSTTSPLVSGSVVIIRQNHGIVAVNLQDGLYIWSYDTLDINNAVPITNLSIGNGNVYFTSPNNGYLYALDIATGQQKWKCQCNLNNNINLSAPVFYNGKVYVGDSAGNFYTVQADTGKLVGQPIVVSEGDLSPYAIFIEDGIAYLTAIASQKAKFYAVDLSSQGP